jgi:hypothetical protein
MHTRFIGFAMILALVGAVSSARGQESTERFIPVGMSPGLSHQYTYIGEIEGVSAESRTITVTGPEGSRTISVTDQTRIWLDRTASKLTNLRGGFEDLQAGRRIEVKYVDYERKEVADWIKVVVSG